MPWLRETLACQHFIYAHVYFQSVIDDSYSSEEERNSGGRESVSITEMEACLENGNAFNRSEQLRTFFFRTPVFVCVGFEKDQGFS